MSAMLSDEDLAQVRCAIDELESEQAAYWSSLAYRQRFNLMHRYGITPIDWGRMAAAQDGKCASCGEESARLVVDHDHATGEVRALLCHRCNTLVGWLETSSEKQIEGAQNYLKTHARKPIR